MSTTSHTISEFKSIEKIHDYRRYLQNFIGTHTSSSIDRGNSDENPRYVSDEIKLAHFPGVNLGFLIPLTEL